MEKIFRIFWKSLLFLLILLALYSLIQPVQWLGKISLYNRIYPGRERLPFGENPRIAYNFSLNNLDAMFASHKLHRAEKQDDDFRILFIGDSSLWGTLLKPEETLAGRLDQQEMMINGKKRKLQTFNLAYPTLALSKDLLILNRGLQYQPDLIVWSLTMESFPYDKQLSTALVNNNLPEFLYVAQKSNLSAPWLPSTASQSFYSRTLLGQRHDLADLIRLQLYGFMWAATGIDQDYPSDYPKPKTDLDADSTFHGVEGPYPDEKMAWDLLTAAHHLAGQIPILIMNEPILISHGKNSEIRYNFYYPRQAYDVWRESLLETCRSNHWPVLDVWNVLPTSDFTNSAIHYDANGAEKLAKLLSDAMESIFN